MYETIDFSYSNLILNKIILKELTLGFEKQEFSAILV